MEENYEITTETLRTGLDEVLDWLKDEIKSASKNAPFTEQGKKSGPSEFSQDVDAYEKLWKIRQAELNRDLESDIKNAEKERKNCEYLEETAQKNKELKLKERELELKEREMYVKELSAKENCRWWNKPIAQTALVCLTTLAVNGVAIYMNGSESPLKSIYEKWMVRPRL